ncbi:MotA/TolQ/ExbB proton channel family protein [Curvibacter sp. RS43]|jgi:biopolymer transport protein ExbB|uniref:Biopolymer transport protein ExbB n=1 Tax=Curvibacter microcysteis TaxID=3026419 RepID=A0ABT5MLX4_9BURK|nr:MULTISPECIES: MotA/TolQ/ExbB proton channel family protein [unclassified Curvibacter]MDD0810819.1 MotA/TolQ/ExbB proton channel family protein [Curvibacter sp. RS43]MDD0816225.1 MotA/TolQ/ExbB proton channel family protein [Curvibacter sp. HBC28]
MGSLQFLSEGDGLSRGVAVLLLLMSVASWVVILRKSWVLRRALSDVQRGTAAFWQSDSWAQAQQRLGGLDRDGVLLPLVRAAEALPAGTLATSGSREQQLTRQLRDALHLTLLRLQWGQVALATVGSTAPFVGLLGTVWGIFHALTALAGVRTLTLDQVAGPVGEALVMTAAGLGVAIPAVLAYNVMGRVVGRIEADLEGFARDLRELKLHPASAAPSA